MNAKDRASEIHRLGSGSRRQPAASQYPKANHGMATKWIHETPIPNGHSLMQACDQTRRAEVRLKSQTVSFLTQADISSMQERRHAPHFDCVKSQ